MFDLAGANSESQSSKGAVRRGVAVATDHCSAWQGETLFRTDDVDNALPVVTHSKVCKTKGLDVLFKGLALRTRILLLNELGDVLEIFPGRGRNVLTQLSFRRILLEMMGIRDQL